MLTPFGTEAIISLIKMLKDDKEAISIPNQPRFTARTR